MDELKPCPLRCDMKLLNVRINNLNAELSSMGEKDAIQANKKFLLEVLNYMQELHDLRREEDNRRPAPENKAQWISVKDRLPEVKEEPEGYMSDVGTAVLVCEEDGYVYEATFWKKSSKFQDGGYDCFPAYWMQLPKPPQIVRKPEGSET